MGLLVEIEIGNQPPCRPTDPKAVGNYVCNLHFWGENRIEHRFIPTGPRDPSTLPIGVLMPVLLQVAEKRAFAYANKNEVPLSKLVGMSVLRHCMHPIEGNGELRYIGERVATYGFVEDVDTFYPAEYSQFGSKLSMYGMSSHLRVTRPGVNASVMTQHLLATPAQEKQYPVNYAAPSLANREHRDKAWIALRAMPDETRFLETLVSHEELLDTYQRPE